MSNYMKWTTSDSKGEVTYVGRVLSSKKDVVVLETSVGTMTVSKDDGSFAPARKPKNAPVVTKVEKKVKKEKATVTHTVKSKKRSGPSKKDAAIVLYESLISKDGRLPSRKVVIDAFIDKLDMTVAGASTYEYTVRKIVQAK